MKNCKLKIQNAERRALLGPAVISLFTFSIFNFALMGCARLKPQMTQMWSAAMLAPSALLVVPQQQTFHLSWVPGALSSAAPAYEVVRYTTDLRVAFENWTILATSAPPVTVAVPFNPSGAFAIEDVFTNQ